MPDYPVKFEGKSLTFAVSNENDAVQRNHVAGRFYELDDLLVHRQLIPAKGVVIDVGANVGNHTLFYARHTRAAVVYPLEPNPVARDLLTRNIEANELSQKVDLSKVRYGAGARSELASVVDTHPDNLGMVGLAPAATGSVQIERLDDLFAGVTPDLIKIDVEGMELDVLAGASLLIARTKPALAIEVDNHNIAAFWRWADGIDYHVINAFRAHRPNINYVCVSRR